MISNLRISVAELVVWALLAAAGLTWITLRALDGAAWLMDWLRDRPRIGWVRDWWYDRRHLSPDREPEFKSGLCAGCWDDSEHCDGAIDTCNCTCTWPEDWAEQSEECEPLGLPPERTWEQMTSHQLPLARPRYDPNDGLPELWAAQDRGEAKYGDDPARFAPQRERRPPWWEAEHRAAYESLGLDYPSGLLARMREAAQ